MNLRPAIITFVVLAFSLQSFAQSNTMYFQPLIPQAYFLNPASQPRCNFFLALPLTYYIEKENSSLHLSDLIWNDPETGRVMHPFHPDANLDDFFNMFGGENRLGLDIALTPISFGFRIRQMFFTFDVTSKTSLGFSYPRAFMELALLGPAENTTYDFSGLGFHLTEHLEYALGISRKFGDILTVGVRPKLLTGVAHISSTGNDISLFTSHEIWQLNSDINLQMSVPGLIIPTDAEGNYDPEGELVFDSTLSGFDDYKKILMSNKGFGIDLGLQFKPVEKLTVSASVIDIGFINWKNNSRTASLEGSLDFEGIEIGLNNEADTSNFARDLWDSVKGSFDVSQSAGSFKTSLDPKIFIGGNYALTRRIDAGILGRFDLLESGMKARMIIHGTWHPSTFYALTISYCPLGDQANTFGTAVSGRIGPLSYYTVFDYRAIKYRLYKYQTEFGNIPVAFSPVNRSKSNIRFGLNIVIGSNQKKKLKKDKPMYYTGE
jgi:hypothetical protein